MMMNNELRTNEGIAWCNACITTPITVGAINPIVGFITPTMIKIK
jgi:hypothetical protein